MTSSTLTPVRLTAVADVEQEDGEHLALEAMASVRANLGMVKWFGGRDDWDPSPLAA